jgi:hypothetical protein
MIGHPLSELKPPAGILRRFFFNTFPKRSFPRFFSYAKENSPGQQFFLLSGRVLNMQADSA